LNEKTGDELPDATTVEFLNCAFPSGLDEKEYFPLLQILLNSMTLRAALWLVEVIISKHYMDVYNDALRVKSGYSSDSIILDRLKKCLEDCGYMTWLEIYTKINLLIGNYIKFPERLCLKIVC
jgi:hypothetical protein